MQKKGLYMIRVASKKEIHIMHLLFFTYVSDFTISSSKASQQDIETQGMTDDNLRIRVSNEKEKTSKTQWLVTWKTLNNWSLLPFFCCNWSYSFSGSNVVILYLTKCQSHLSEQFALNHLNYPVMTRMILYDLHVMLRCQNAKRSKIVFVIFAVIDHL